MSFNGACSKYGNGVGIVFKILQYGTYPHTIRLEFTFTNNKYEHEEFIQGMILSLQMRVENLVVTCDSELAINHINKKYRIKK
jgi:ribonuclease HI